MKYMAIFIGGAMLVQLSGCSLHQFRLPQLPFHKSVEQEGYPASVDAPPMEQMALRSASHWDFVARNESRHIMTAMDSFPVVHVRAAEDGSPFSAAFQKMLVANLVKEGADVMRRSSDALYELEYDIQVLTHRRPHDSQQGQGVAEVMVSMRVHDGNRIRVADSRVYYINEQDLQNFGEGRSFPVIGATEQ